MTEPGGSFPGWLLLHRWSQGPCLCVGIHAVALMCTFDRGGADGDNLLSPDVRVPVLKWFCFSSLTSNLSGMG